MEMLSGLIEGLVVTLREGVEVALVIGILLAALHRTGRGAYRAFVFLGLGAAILASLAGGVALRRYGLDPENPLMEGVLMLVAAGLVASLVGWMWRAGRAMRGRVERRLGSLVTAPTVTVRAAAGVLAFTFLMVLREGVETVLLLLALGRTSATVPLLVGSTAGLGLAASVGLLLSRGAVRVNLQRFFGVTSLVLLILVVKLVAGGLHEFIEQGILAAGPHLEEFLELLANRVTSAVVLALLVAAPLVAMARDARQHAGAQRGR